MTEHHEPNISRVSSPAVPRKTGYRAVVGQTLFEEATNWRLMSRVTQYIANLPDADFQAARASAGPITVRFGRTLDRSVGEWHPRSRTVLLNPYHKSVRERGSSRLMGTAVFEIIHAATEATREHIEAHAHIGHTEELAAAEGITPASYHARAMASLEFGNIRFHRRIMANIGKSGTRADLFHGENQEFHVYYNIQVRTGRTRGHEHRYHVLRQSSYGPS
ncbi:hypothetical protein OG946_24730 [Streptomyces sp. NBC_01808]|uniref:hypothetical protein n=1 Tax=Streptomyces sp. NBC_01808 TaxID=2975947 RepID=UPI002DDB8BF0|nr:hypothetical protein [Streptomyces sp. NBC_01808]WSA40288.1 hypothetical protein OG946_24730 [Streptomyces sp. NBC_01808]